MALNKQVLDISFAKGLDTKSDPFRVQADNFLNLSNSIFTKTGRLTKRNGFQKLTSIEDTTVTSLSTFNGALTAFGESLYTYSDETSQWYNKGEFTPLSLSVSPLVRMATSQSQQDSAVDANGLACTVWVDSDGELYYQVSDSATNQVIVEATEFGGSSTTSGIPRVFSLGNYFLVVYKTLVGSDSLSYIPIPKSDPANAGSPVVIATNALRSSASYDGIVANDILYLAYNATDVGGAVRLTRIDTALQVYSQEIVAGYDANFISVAADTSTPTPTIWCTFQDNTGVNPEPVYTCSFSSILDPILAPTLVSNRGLNDLVRLTTAANNQVLTVFLESINTYSFSSAVSDYIGTVTVSYTGTVTPGSVICRGVAIASKAFTVSGSIYLMVAYGVSASGATGGLLQPTYFIIKDDGSVVAKVAYSIGGGYPAGAGLPSVNISGSEVKIAYLIKNLLAPVNKSQDAASPDGVYSQTGINLLTIDINNNVTQTAEVGNNLHMSGGYLWMYDGNKPTEHNFHLFPEDITVTTATTGGSITAQEYFYQVCYEWTDSQGNIHRSAPSVPVSITTTGATSTNTVNIPTLRLTNKVNSNGLDEVRIVIYRWSQAQQNYYQITSIPSPLMNDVTVDSVTYTDTAADSTILGNLLLYTTGGVVENIAAPACVDLSLYKSRLFLIDAEDPNLIWYSKQVIESTPVEMSDLFTIYLAPTTGAQGSTGATKVITSMDDKNIFFKANAIYYNTGNGPDNTGANNDFSEPVFITATVGCSNPNSIVFQPEGIMFQSDKGIWLLGRDLSTTYIGAPVERFTESATVVAAINVPGTNQVRFTMDSGITLMYDYFVRQWGTFTNIPAVSSAVYQDLHTFLNSSGEVFQESPGTYTDGTRPVLMSFTSAWLNLAGVQGFERAYEMYLLGTYISPHKLNVLISYDYNSSYEQSVVITPDNYAGTYGSAPIYGNGTPYGGEGPIEQWRVFFSRQKCQSFQITVNELFDSSYDTEPGAGVSLSGVSAVIGVKAGVPKLRATRQAG